VAFRLDIDQRHIDAIARGYRDLAERAAELRPVGYRVRDRWLEGERRVFRARRWAPRAASTRRRYRWPVRRWRRGGTGPMRRGPVGAVGEFTGEMRKGLTRPRQPGQRDSIEGGTRGGLDVTVGAQRRGPLAHAHLFDGGAGRRPPRAVVVFDEIAHGDAAGDVIEYLIGRHAGRVA